MTKKEIKKVQEYVRSVGIKTSLQLDRVKLIEFCKWAAERGVIFLDRR